MTFKYLGVEIKSDSSIYNEVKSQMAVALQISGCLRDFIWHNKYLTISSKAWIYKTAVRLIMTV